MHDLQLAVNLAGWRIFVRRKQDKAFLPVRDRVLSRDAYTCQFCAFQAQEYQEVVNLDGNYTHNTLSNMVTACCFCSQCLFLQSVGVEEMGGGQLIYMPEMSQADLNSFCHVLFCAMDSNTGYQDSSQSIYRSLKFRSQLIENQFGTGMSNPNIMGQVIIESETLTSEKRTDLLKDLRLLPSHAKFRVQLEAWAAAAMKELVTEPSSEKNEDEDEDE